MKTCLLIIDIQNDYFPGGRMALEGAGPASENAAALLAAFRRLQLPVIHVQHVATQPGATFFLPETEGADIHASVRPCEGEAVIQKHYPSAFRQTGLLAYLGQQGIGKLVVAGMMTHMCIDTTTRAGCDLGFPIELAHDACATKALAFGGIEVPAMQVQAAYLAALNGVFATVRGTQEIIAALAAEQAGG